MWHLFGLPQFNRCRADLEHVGQSRPDSGLGIHVNVLVPLKLRSFRLEADTVNLELTPMSTWSSKSNPVLNAHLDTKNDSTPKLDPKLNVHLEQMEEINEWMEARNLPVDLVNLNSKVAPMLKAKFSPMLNFKSNVNSKF